MRATTHIGTGSTLGLALGLVSLLSTLPVHAAPSPPPISHRPLDAREQAALVTARRELHADLARRDGGKTSLAPRQASPTAQAPPKLTTIDLEELAPRTGLRARLAKPRFGKATPAPQKPESWDLARLAEGDFRLPHHRIDLTWRQFHFPRAWMRFSTTHLDLEFDGQGVPSLLWESAEGVKSRPDRARLAWFGIHTQADLDAFVLRGMLTKAEKVYEVKPTDPAHPQADATTVPHAWQIPGERSLRFMDMRERTPEQRASLRAQLLARVEEERQLKLTAEGVLHAEDLDLLYRLRNLAPVVPAEHARLSSPVTRQTQLVLATRGTASLIVGKSWPGAERPRLLIAHGPTSGDERAADIHHLRWFGVRTPADLDALIGRAILKYAPEDFLE